MGRLFANHTKTRCPECLAPIYLDQHTQQWAALDCPECHISLWVVSLYPACLDYLDENLARRYADYDPAAYPEAS